MKIEKIEVKDKKSEIAVKDSDPIFDSSAIAYTVGEYFFIILPFIVLTIILLYKKNFVTIISIPEWSMASSLMIGQMIIRTVHHIGKKSIFGFEFYKIGALFSGFICLLLVPSLICLALVNISNDVPLWLSILQISIFIISSLLFFLFNTIITEAETKRF